MLMFIPSMSDQHFIPKGMNMSAASDSFSVHLLLFRKFMLNSSRDLRVQTLHVGRLFSIPNTRLSLEQTGFWVTRWVYFCIKLVPCLVLRKAYTPVIALIIKLRPTPLHGSNEERHPVTWARMTFISSFIKFFDPGVY